MYDLVMMAHSWLRYALLALGVGLLLAAVLHPKGAAWYGRREGVHGAFIGVLHLQLTLGLLLYFGLSPLGMGVLSDFGAAMRVPPMRFFGIEHPITMIIAVVVAQRGRSRAALASPTTRAPIILRAQFLWLVLTALAIPWPFLDVGRPLFRGL